VNWDAVGALAELAGAVGVVVTLGYLASQIRQNSKLLRASTTASSNEVQTHMTALLAQDPEAARIFWDGLADRDSLSEPDRRRFDPLLTLFLQPIRQQYQFERDGIGSAEEWAYQTQGLAWVFEQRGARQWWRAWSGQYPQGFRDVVDCLIRERPDDE
jgi:hypothetical protein